MTLKEAQNHPLAGTVKFSSAAIGLVIAFITMWTMLDLPKPVMSTEMHGLRNDFASFADELRKDRESSKGQIASLKSGIDDNRILILQGKLIDLKEQIADKESRLKEEPNNHDLRALVRQLKRHAENIERRI